MVNKQAVSVILLVFLSTKKKKDLIWVSNKCINLTNYNGIDLVLVNNKKVATKETN